MNKPGRPTIRVLLLVLLTLRPVSALALDHDNLDPNRPIGMEDAYAIPKGEIGMEGGVRFNESEISVTDAPGLGIRAIRGLQPLGA